MVQKLPAIFRFKFQPVSQIGVFSHHCDISCIVKDIRQDFSIIRMPFLPESESLLPIPGNNLSFRVLRFENYRRDGYAALKAAPGLLLRFFSGLDIAGDRYFLFGTPEDRQTALM